MSTVLAKLSLEICVLFLCENFNNVNRQLSTVMSTVTSTVFEYSDEHSDEHSDEYSSTNNDS
jgi:hypothetical protein